MQALTTLKLASGLAEITIAPHRGAIVTSFRVGERELLYLDEATLNDPSKNVRGGIPVLFPNPGKLEGDRWTIAGHSGELKQHGFARNLPWRVEHASAAQAVLRLDSNATTRRGFPWDFVAKLTYSIEAAQLRIEFELTNTSSSALPFAFGLHPYFLVRDKPSARIPTQATRAFDNVSKQMITFAGFDFTSNEVDLHLIDHGDTRGVLDLGDGTKITIDAAPQFSRWVVWTVGGKDYICLEPWTAPGNALNTADGLIELEPQQTSVLWTRIGMAS